MLDTTIELETPEGVDLELRAAGIVVRGMALLADECIRWAIVIALQIPLAAFGGLGWGMLLLVVFATYWLYGVVFEVFRQGQTPGKRLQGIRVIHDDGTPIGLASSVLRNLLVFVDGLPAFYAAGVVTMMLASGFRRLGDLAAGTLVVYAEPRLTKHDETSPDRPLAARKPPVPLTPGEQRAMLAFADRRTSFSPERARELAAVLAPMLQCSIQDAPAELEKIALGLKGGPA